MAKLISHHKERDNGNGPDRVSECILTFKCYQVPQIQPMVIPDPDDVSDEDFPATNPSSPSAGPSAERRGRSRKQRSSLFERVLPHSSSHASQQPQPVVPSSGVQQTQASQGEDEDSAIMDPQNLLSDHARSPQDQEDSRRQGPQTQKGKNCCRKAAE